MLKICTVLFVASAMGMALPAQATSQTRIADLLRGYVQSGPQIDTAAPSVDTGQAVNPLLIAPTDPTFLADNCPHLAQLRTSDLATTLAILYQHNDFAPLWGDPAQLNALRTELAKLADDGLTPGDYPFSQGVSGTLDACAELHISSEYLLALEHLGTGRLDQQVHEPMWREDSSLKRPTALNRWAQRGLNDVPAAFDLARPHLDLYRNLRTSYIRLRDEPADYAPLPPGDLVRPGMQSPRVTLLAKRLESEGYLAEIGLLSDNTDPVSTLTPALEHALKRFQTAHGLDADGVLGPDTLTAMNVTARERLQLARINLERLRWINALREDEVLLVNNAINTLRHYRKDDVLWHTLVISGRAGRKTPALVSHLNRITLNPDWTVPPTIRREDMIPAIRKDRAYLQEKNLIVLDYQGNHLDPETIDWQNPQGLMLRQPPGPSNPLGKVVFRFNNPFSVYLHDTPNKNAFARSRRNLSSGCVRVEGADILADRLFSHLSASNQERIKQQRSSLQTHQIALTEGPQVILGYWTAEANTAGQLVLMLDPYSQDPALLEAFAGIDPPP